jgi:hypothetical protein
MIFSGICVSRWLLVPNHSMSSSLHLKQLLHAVNVNTESCDVQLKQRSMQSMNNYLRLINHRLRMKCDDDVDTRDTVAELLQFIHRHVSGDT